MHPDFWAPEAPVLRTLPDLVLHTSSSDCSPVFFTIPFNKLINASKCFPEFCELVKQIKPKVKATQSCLTLCSLRPRGP